MNFDILSRIDSRITMVQKELDQLLKAKELLKNISIKEDFSAFHKELGHVLVRCYFIGDSNAYNTTPEQEGKLLADVITVNNRHNLEASELLPITEATRVLFSDKN